MLHQPPGLPVQSIPNAGDCVVIGVTVDVTVGGDKEVGASLAWLDDLDVCFEVAASAAVVLADMCCVVVVAAVVVVAVVVAAVVVVVICTVGTVLCWVEDEVEVLGVGIVNELTSVICI